MGRLARLAFRSAGLATGGNFRKHAVMQSPFGQASGVALGASVGSGVDEGSGVKVAGSGVDVVSDAVAVGTIPNRQAVAVTRTTSIKVMMGFMKGLFYDDFTEQICYWSWAGFLRSATISVSLSPAA